MKPHITQKVDDFARVHFGDGNVIGLHIRGTDKGTASLPRHLMRIVRPREYFRHIDDYMHSHGEANIFVATDQHQFLSQIINRYGKRFLSFESDTRHRTAKSLSDQGD